MPAGPSAPLRPAHDVSGRALERREIDLGRFFEPMRIAVIGPSTTPGKPNTTQWRRLRDWADAHGAEIVPVHPQRTELDGRRCYASILDVPGELDLVVILVADAVEMFATVIERQPAFAVIFSAGFAETGADGVARQRRLEALAAQSGTRLLGPNTNLNAFEQFRDLPGRAVALITQSGHQGRPVFQAQDLGVRLSHWAPTGNEADLEVADFIGWFADQDDIGAIAAYVEGFKDGRTLQLAADHAAQAGTPIVCVKVGRTEAGAAMARSHTGHLAGADRVVDAVFAQYGITRVDGLDELADTAATFARTTRPSTDGVCVYSISGGTGAHMADLCAAAGLRLPRLARATQRRLHELIPPYLHVANPVDSGGPPSMDERGPQILEAILADPKVGLVICPITGAVDALSRPLATDLVAAARTTDKPVFVVWGSPDVTDPVYTDILVPSGLPLFRTFANCVTAARAYLRWWAFQDRYRSPFAAAPTRRSPAAREVGELLTSADPLSEHRSKEVLRAYGIRTTRDVLCASPVASARAATALGLPVVMKACAPHLAHKSDDGLVRLGIGSAAEARTVHAELEAAARAADPDADPTRELDGVLVCEQVTGGVECMVGITTDEVFGPVVVFGLGGVLVEVLEDVACRVPPFDRAEARRMIDEVRGAALLHGVRGVPPADITALVDVIMRVQRLALEQADLLDQLDINPLVVLPRGQGAVALDALAVPRPRDSTSPPGAA